MNKRSKKMVVSFVGLILVSSGFADSATNTIYEAENAEELNKGVVACTVAKGFLGTGYADFVGTEGSSMKWTRVFSDKGDATLTFRYSNGSGGVNVRSSDLYVNGTNVAVVEWPVTEKSWEIWKTREVNVVLKRGINTIELRLKTMQGPNIDQLIVTSCPIELKTVPDVTGLSCDDAKSRIRSAGLIVGTVTTECSNTVQEGMIMRQSETANSSVPVDTPVDIVVSQGPLVIG